MITSRRRAIQLGICATASLVTIEGLGEDVAVAQALPQPADDGRWIQRGQFERCAGQSMTARTSPKSIGLQLIRVDDVPNAAETAAVGDPNSFIVLFRGPRSPRLKQGTYRIESRALGTFSLFLVPGGAYGSGTAYTATFNRRN